MDILFVLAALCPALLVTRYEAGGKELPWQAWVGKAAGWFYTVTFVNFCSCIWTDGAALTFLSYRYSF